MILYVYQHIRRHILSIDASWAQNARTFLTMGLGASLLSQQAVALSFAVSGFSAVDEARLEPQPRRRQGCRDAATQAEGQEESEYHCRGAAWSL